MPRKSSAKASSIITGLLFAAYAFLLFFKVTEIPLAFNVDEAGAAYDAYSLANYYCDRYLYRFPVYFINFGGGQNALYTYLAAVLIKLFGYSILIVRLPAILLGLLSMLLSAIVVRKEHGGTASVINAFFFCILPFSIMHARWGLESYLLFPMLILSLSAFYHALRSAKGKWFVFSGILFGVTLYSYTVSYLLLPLFLVLFSAYLLYCRKVSLKHLLYAGIPLFLAAIPLLLMLAVNSGYIEEIKMPFFSVPRFPLYRAGEVNFRNILQNLKFTENNFFYNLFVNDHCVYNIIPKFGSLYYPSIPLLVYGLILCLRKSISEVRQKRYSFDLLMVLFFFVVLFVGLMFERMNANRGCAVYIPLIYFLTIGFLEILKKSKPAAAILSVVFLGLFLSFCKYYFTDFANDIRGDSMFASMRDIENAQVFAESLDTDETIYVLDSVQPYIFTLLSKGISPYEFDVQKVLSNDYFVKILGRYRFRLDAVMPECIYIVNSQYPPDGIESYGFAARQFGSVTVYYPPAE